MPSLGMSKETPSNIKTSRSLVVVFPVHPRRSHHDSNTNVGVLVLPLRFLDFITYILFGELDDEVLLPSRHENDPPASIQRCRRCSSPFSTVSWSYPLLRSSLKSHRVSATSLDLPTSANRNFSNSLRKSNPASSSSHFTRPSTTVYSQTPPACFAQPRDALSNTFSLRKNTSFVFFFVFFVDVKTRQAP